jgi:serine/threonine-protein kinase RsbW
MAAEASPLTLTVPSDLRLLPVICGFVEAACQVGGADRHTTDAVVLATNEAVNNVIRHAHRDRPEAVLQIECRLGSSAVEVVLRDQGDPFNLASVPYMDPCEMRVGGRGVFLMRKLMDEVNCEPCAHGNVLRMVKRCCHGSSQPPAADSA